MALLLVSEVLEKAKVQIEVLKDLFGGLAEILRECPGQYYRRADSLWAGYWSLIFFLLVLFLLCFSVGCA